MDDFVVAASALFPRMVTARARIHGGYEHKVCGIAVGSVDAGDSDFFILQRLAKGIQCVSGKFGKFVQKKNTVVGK